ncbi:MAG TPA: arginine--tRNA ligase [Verrucomicrobiae bacterium]
MLPHKQIELKLQSAVREILPDADVSAVLVRPCDPKFGDYQSNALMSLAKTRKMNPRQLAENVLAKLDVSDICEKVEIAGAGFLNFRLKNSVLAQTLESAACGEHLFFEKTSQPKTVVVDFSSPNVAKPMHVGHIRSTILGDSLACVLKKLGHNVIRDNHIGDWGTQFGYILIVWKDFLKNAPTALKRYLDSDPITTMGTFYQYGRIAGQINDYEDLEGSDWVQSTSEEQDKKARAELVKLQSGDPETLAIWREMIALSQKQFDEIYSRLGVKFNVTLGESFYNNRLTPLIEELLEKKIARESEGAIAIFFDDNPQLKEHPALIRKSDGGFNYAATDLATLDYRISGEILRHPQVMAELGKIDGPVNEIIYVTDGRQQLHFQQIFTAFQKWQTTKAESGKRKAETKFAHVWFGSILGEDGKPLKTRSKKIRIGDLLSSNWRQFFAPNVSRAIEIEHLHNQDGTFFVDLRDQIVDWDELCERTFKTPYGDFIKLKDLQDDKGNRLSIPPSPASLQLAGLLNEAEERAFKIVSEKNPELPETQRKEIARVVGIGAVKYADLLPNRQSDYIFSWDKMLALQGNTAPYLLYAYARIKSIFRKAESGKRKAEIVLAATEEIALAKHLLNFGLTLEAVAEEYRPNFLCNYLFELAGKFTGFYENCPVLKSEGAVRDSRLALCDLTARVLKLGLETLGIETVEQM